MSIIIFVSFFGGGTCWLPDARASDARLLYDAIEASSPGRASPFLFNFQNVQAVTFLNVLLFSWKAVPQVIFVGRVSGSKF